ncbi:alkaline shock response membrane anchor protein AmaP [Streptomyces sp. YIM 98790]|uniref:alkaline shock response membrane anchor protein AmaP n=1 Tax=Streptomyces sp. YIM 98790 TaxID=2689077 RepID=UPI00140E5CF9|nr:alkaline shock response membrane anchor protein AmaP [Streptomyces sp. YIM 98790]
MLRVVNRVLLALTGLLLMAAGAAVLAGALDLPRRLGLADLWPWSGPDDVLLTRADRVQWRDDGWWWPVVIGGLVLLVLLALWWVLAQMRRDRLHELWVETGDGGGAHLGGRALEDVVAAEAEALPGVDRAGVTLVGRRSQPRLRIGLLLGPQGEPGEAVRRLRAEVVAHARASTGLKTLPVEVRVRASRHAPERVS